MKLSLKLQPRFAPRKPRAGVAIEATLLLPDDGVLPILIKNISDAGFMGETDAAVNAGTLIGIELPGCGIVPALVRWATTGEIGAQFRRPIDLERLLQPLSPEIGERKLFWSRLLGGPF